MKEIVNDKNLIAYCGLYCGACPKYLKGKCPGCKENQKAGWCKVRTCCMESSYHSCADCSDYNNVNDCKKYNNFMAKLFALIFRSNHKACIDYIKSNGYEAFSAKMTEDKIQSFKK